MGKESVYTIEYLSEICIEDKKESIKEQFLLNCCDKSKSEVNKQANNVHLENLDKAYEAHPNKHIEHSLKRLNQSKEEILKYKFSTI